MDVRLAKNQRKKKKKKLKPLLGPDSAFCWIPNCQHDWRASPDCSALVRIGTRSVTLHFTFFKARIDQVHGYDAYRHTSEQSRR